MNVRQALLDDTAAISALFRARIPAWQRLTHEGAVETVPYDGLTVYERWTHGGPWMSPETAALALARLLHGVGLALVAEQDGQIVGYLEGYPGYEPAPFGAHLHIAHILSAPNAPQAEDALLVRAAEVAAHLPDKRLTVSVVSDSGEDARAYHARGFAPLSSARRYVVPVKAGQGFYQVGEHTSSSVAQIEGWQMPVGRTESASMLWESVWVSIWEVIPQLAERRIQRLKLNAAGQELLLCAQPVPHDPRTADVWAWSPRPLTGVLLTAILDWAHRQRYRALRMILDAQTAKLLGNDAEADPFSRSIWARRA